MDSPATTARSTGSAPRSPSPAPAFRPQGDQRDGDLSSPCMGVVVDPDHITPIGNPGHQGALRQGETRLHRPDQHPIREGATAGAAATATERSGPAKLRLRLRSAPRRAPGSPSPAPSACRKRSPAACGSRPSHSPSSSPPTRTRCWRWRHGCPQQHPGVFAAVCERLRKQEGHHGPGSSDHSPPRRRQHIGAEPLKQRRPG